MLNRTRLIIVTFGLLVTTGCSNKPTAGLAGIPPAQVDLSSPEAAVKSYATAALAGDEAAVLATVSEHPRSQESAKALAQFVVAYNAFKAAVRGSSMPAEDKAKLLDDRADMLRMMLDVILGVLAVVRQGEGLAVADRPDANTAEVSFGIDGYGPATVRRANGRWRVDLSSPGGSEVGLYKGAAAMFGGVAPRIRSGELRTAAAVTAAMIATALPEQQH